MQLLSILSNQMVFQQRIKVNLWGEVEPNGQMTIKYSCISNCEEITLKDILKGKVWFRTKQSNISIPLQERNGQLIKGANKVLIKVQEKIASKFFAIACKTSVAQLENTGGEWLRFSPENLQKTSGVDCFSGQLLQEILNIPIGLVLFSCRDSKIKAWLDYKVVDDMLGVLLHHSLYQLCNAMIYPFRYFTIEGFLWHQGENNQIAPKTTRLFPELPKSFCKVWELGNLPFYYARLTPCKCNGAEKAPNVRVRKVQMQNKKKTSNAGMVITLDVGDGKYGHLIKKRKIGQRLVYLSLAKIYGCEEFRYQLPVCESAEIREQEAFFSFENSSYYIVFPLVNLKNFEVTGRDRVAHQGKVGINIQTQHVIATSKNIIFPIAVYYVCEQYTKTFFMIMPILPFRSDDWSLDY